MERKTDRDGTHQGRRATPDGAERKHRPNRREGVQLSVPLNAEGWPSGMQSSVKRAAVRRAVKGVCAANRNVAGVPNVR